MRLTSESLGSLCITFEFVLALSVSILASYWISTCLLLHGQKQCLAFKRVKDKRNQAVVIIKAEIHARIEIQHDPTDDTTEIERKTVTTRARVHLPVKQYKRVSGHTQDRYHTVEAGRLRPPSTVANHRNQERSHSGT